MAGIYDDAHLAGGMTADWWERDPKRMAFVAARYKFVARVLQGKARVLEVGCADGHFSRIVRQHVGYLCAVDVDAASIGEAVRDACKTWPINFVVHDMLKSPMGGFDAAYALDVLEHIEKGAAERDFLTNMKRSAPVCIFGTPSAESQTHASKLSREGHVNCMTESTLRVLLGMYFRQVFIFGMNDEALHTGFGPMAHYRLALCVA